jgi:hypothetical protein
VELLTASFCAAVSPFGRDDQVAAIIMRTDRETQRRRQRKNNVAASLCQRRDDQFLQVTAFDSP